MVEGREAQPDNVRGPFVRWGLRVITIALIALALWPSPPDSASPLDSTEDTVVEDSGIEDSGIMDSADEDSTDEQLPAIDAQPSADQPNEQGTQPAPLATVAANPSTQSAGLTISSVTSPAPSQALVEGTLTPGSPAEVTVVIDDVPVATVVLATDEQNEYRFIVEGLSAGPQTLCLANVCSSVVVAGNP